MHAYIGMNIIRPQLHHSHVSYGVQAISCINFLVLYIRLGVLMSGLYILSKHRLIQMNNQ